MPWDVLTVAFLQEVPACYVKRVFLCKGDCASDIAVRFSTEQWELTPLSCWLRCLFCLSCKWVSYTCQLHSTCSVVKGRRGYLFAKYYSHTLIALWGYLRHSIQSSGRMEDKYCELFPHLHPNSLHHWFGHWDSSFINASLKTCAACNRLKTCFCLI